MSVETITARVAELDARMLQLVRGPQPAAPPATEVGQTTALPGSAANIPFAQALGAAQGVAPGADAASAGPFGAEIDAAAQRYGIEPALLTGLVRQESGFDPAARSSAGALGLTQLMPGTAAELGVTNPLDPRQALDGGARYLRQQLDRFGGDVEKALAAYNAGPGAVARFGGVPPYAETQNYVQRVLQFAGEAGLGRRTTPAATPTAVQPLPTGALPYSTT